MGEPNPNAKTLSITMRCLHCGAKFPSPIFMTPYSNLRYGNALRESRPMAASCGKMTGCNKENFLARFEGGGWVGNDAL